MKHEMTTLNTKKALAASLKKLLSQKAFSKITVSEIVQDCGVNRKTFYYHFEDIYALLKWMLEQETVEVIKGFDLLVDYEEAINFAIDYIDANKHMINCIYDSFGRDGMKRFLYDDLIGVTGTIVDSVEQMEQLHVPEGFKQFVSQFYAEAVAGIIVDWLQDRLRRSREEVLQNLVLIFRSSLPAILRAKAAEGQSELKYAASGETSENFV